MPFNWKGT